MNTPHNETGEGAAAYAKQFNNSTRWYVCDRPGGNIIAIGESEAEAWAAVRLVASVTDVGAEVAR